MIISMKEFCSSFAENKDTAKQIRENFILPQLKASSEPVILDFQEIESSTQSFIHALISDIFQRNGNSSLNRFEFKNCNNAIKTLITTVINYSLE